MQLDKKTSVPKAYCSSNECNPRYLDKKGRIQQNYKYVQKKVKASATTCPDCGNILYWKPK